MTKKQITNNTKLIIILAVAGGIIVFATNFLPDFFEEAGETISDEYHYETTFPNARPVQKVNEERITVTP